MNVLVADDSEVIRERLAELCAGVPGARLLGAAASGHDALRQIESLRPHVVMTDLHMPHGSGFELLQAGKRRFPETIFIIFTCDTSTQNRARCMALGADFYFLKSRDYRALSSTLQQLAEQQRHTREQS